MTTRRVDDLVGRVLGELGALEQRSAEWSIVATKHQLQLNVGYEDALYTLTLSKRLP